MSNQRAITPDIAQLFNVALSDLISKLNAASNFLNEYEELISLDLSITDIRFNRVLHLQECLDLMIDKTEFVCSSYCELFAEYYFCEFLRQFNQLFLSFTFLPISVLGTKEVHQHLTKFKTELETLKLETN